MTFMPDYEHIGRMLQRIDEETAARRLELVRTMRRAGCSWQKIGDTIGLTQVGAMKRYKPVLEAEHQAA